MGREQRPGWPELMVHYRQAHRQLGTRITHLFGIPMIVLALPVALLKPAVGVGMFVCGWALQFIGHYVYEKNDPQFFGDPRNLLVGILWSAIEWRHLVSRVLGRRGASPRH